MVVVRLFICLSYLTLLTVLLLVPNPAAVVGLQRVPVFPWGDIGIHFTAFAVLTLLVHALRWPRQPAWVVIFALWTYGIATESLQAFVPRRTVELKDYIENITGVLAGSGVHWLIQRWIEQRRGEPERRFEADARAVSTGKPRC